MAILRHACWHRLLPLSKGRLNGDEVTCRYPGLVYNADGRRTHMPAQETINPSACVRSFPVVERRRFVWVWPVEAALADPALVPDMHGNDAPASAVDGKMIRVNGDYRLLLDHREPAADPSPSPSQTVKAQLALRELILGGELKTGARIAERWLVERLGVSRPPVRLALVRLAEQGLLDALPSGGYAVKEFSESDVQDAIEVRGTLEGLAARLATERGVSPVLITEARECLERIDTALAQPALTDATFSVCVEANARCYALLSGMACQLDKAMALPFASPNGFVMAHSVGPRARDVLVVAQEQHRMVIEAIVQREGARGRPDARARPHHVAQFSAGAAPSWAFMYGPANHFEPPLGAPQCLGGGGRHRHHAHRRHGAATECAWCATCVSAPARSRPTSGWEPASRASRASPAAAWCSPRPGEAIDDAERCKPCSSSRGSLHYARPLFSIRHPETRNGDTP